MVRAISVLLSVLVLLGIGWYLGHRPVAELQSTLARIEATGLARVGEPRTPPEPEPRQESAAPQDTTPAAMPAALADAAQSGNDGSSRADSLSALLGAAEARADVAEARSKLWQARSEMLVAAMEVGKMNFSRAREWARGARDHITQANATPGLGLELGAVTDMLDSSIHRLEVTDGEAVNLLMRAATELRRLLEQAGRA